MRVGAAQCQCSDGRPLDADLGSHGISKIGVVVIAPGEVQFQLLDDRHAKLEVRCEDVARPDRLRDTEGLDIVDGIQVRVVLRLVTRFDTKSQPEWATGQLSDLTRDPEVDRIHIRS